MKSWRLLIMLLGVIVLGIGITACGNDNNSNDAETATTEKTGAVDDDNSGGTETTKDRGTIVKVELGESSPDKYFVKLDRDKVPAGKVTFEIDNVGELYHEMIVYKSDLSPGDIPVDKAEDKAELEENDEIGEAVYASPLRGEEDHHIRPERGVDMTLTLEAGKYILLCDIAGHYSSKKQYVGFTVE